MDEQVRRRILTAPLWMPTTKWSSRSIAAAAGVSQSAVARTWRSARVPNDVAAQLTAWVDGGGSLALVGLVIDPTGSTLMVKRSEAGERARPNEVARMEHSYRAVLAADELRDDMTDCGSDDVRRAVFDRELAGCISDGVDVLVLSSTLDPTPSTRGVGTHLALERHQWQGLHPHLARLHCSTDVDTVAELENRLRHWHQSGATAFTWTASSTVPASKPAGRPRRGRGHPPRAPQRVLADQIVDEIRRGIAEGRFTGGDNVTERYLADRLRTTRAQIHTALRLLADEGLVSIDTGHGPTVPIPTNDDVLELYSARRALGVIAVGAAVPWSPTDRASVLAILRELEDCAARGDTDAAQLLDQRFQTAVTESSRLWRIPGILESLSQQVLMYVSVLGIRYAFPVADIVARDRELFDAIDGCDRDRAIALWQLKIEESAAYMLRRLGPPRGRGPCP